MNGKNQETIIEWAKDIGIILFILFVVLFIVRIESINPSLSDDDGCRLEYGENWSYDKDFHFGRVCVRLDYDTLEVVEKKAIGWTVKDIEENYCDRPGFFNFKIWDDGCPEMEKIIE